MSYDANDYTGELDTAGLIDAFTYLDVSDPSFNNMTMEQIITRIENGPYHLDGEQQQTLEILRTACNNDSNFANLTCVAQYSADTNPKDELVQAVCFRGANDSGSDNYYFSYRGTGDGRWVDNAYGLYGTSQCQRASSEFFDSVCESEGITSDDFVTVSGHSKGGDESIYTNYTARHNDLIDLCAPIDGQGLSSRNIEDIRSSTTVDQYAAMNNRVISINGENDPVNRLGEAPFDEGNKYYIRHGRYESIGDLHTLNSLLLNENGEYESLTGHFYTVDGRLDRHYPGPVSNIARRLYETLIVLPEEQGSSVARGLMNWIDLLQGHERIGDSDVSFMDGLRSIGYGIPLILGSILFTEEGHEFLQYVSALTAEAVAGMINQYIYEPIAEIVGPEIAGLITAVLITTLAIVAAKYLLPYVAKLILVILAVIAVIALVTLAIDLLLGIVDCLKKVWEFALNFTPGGAYANNHPHIVINTDKMYRLAGDLDSVKGRIRRVNSRIDSLYANAATFTDGLEWDDLDNIVFADFLSQFNLILQGCINYLNSTADGFIRADNEVCNLLRG